MGDSQRRLKVAAGGIVVDRPGEDVRLLCVHRPRYDDWSFPKGGVEPGESYEEAALREVKEESGLECRIIRKLTISRYVYETRRGEAVDKIVHYFLMERTGGHIEVPEDEVDGAGWFTLAEAEAILSYDRDKDLLKLL